MIGVVVMTDLNNKLRSTLNEWIEKATAADKELLLQVMKGTETKNSEKMHTYISAVMQMNKLETTDGSVKIEIPNTPFLSNSLGIMHGGLTSTLLDSAMGTAANLNLEKNEGAVTLDLNIRFLSPGIGESFICEASVKKSGRQIIVTEGTVKNEKEQEIAIATGTFFKVNR
ncbi:PaaI family thioesterase [Fictibacillus iocasae]|uniref:PaaI family thioesterase n=1 Tax=Fictibacillus iocasae TaxID=2715437 RepID=A0ABW2NTT5_9BACL